MPLIQQFSCLVAVSLFHGLQTRQSGHLLTVCHLKWIPEPRTAGCKSHSCFCGYSRRSPDVLCEFLQHEDFCCSCSEEKSHLSFHQGTALGDLPGCPPCLFLLSFLLDANLLRLLPINMKWGILEFCLIVVST